jgi:hypothetical protein
MQFFLDPSPVRARDLSEAELAGTAGGALLPLFVAAVVRCGQSFAGTVIAVVQVVD